MRHLSRPVWTLLGSLSLALAALGVVLPLLPTTPLVILAAFCFSRGSARFEAWLLASPTFGPIIADWRTRGAIPRRAKAIAVTAMLAAFGLSLALGLKPWLLAVQALCLLGAAAFVLTRPD